MKTFKVTIQEIIQWTDEIECDTGNHNVIEGIVLQKWINSEYSDKDSTACLGAPKVIHVTEIKK